MPASSAPRCGPPAMDRVRPVLHETGLWRDLTELPDTLAATLEAHIGFSDVAALLGNPRVRRIVASGNGAAYYVCVALWLASLEGREGPEVLAVPSGLLARGAFAWRRGTCSWPSPRPASSAISSRRST